MLRNIRMTFQFMDKDMIKKILTTVIRPKLVYAEVVWCSYKKKNINKLERIQRIATKMVPELKYLSYKDRLKEMQLTTLQERRERGDLITVYKLINELEKVDREGLLLITESETRHLRGHSKKLRKGSCLHNTKKYSFCHRSEDVWNKLKKEVIEPKNIRQLKEKLDKYRYGDGTTRV